MNDLFTTRSRQNLHAAQLLFDAALYDASVNRSYYAVFDAAFVACLHFGVEVKPDHAKVLSAFCGELIARRKVFPSHLKKDLYELQHHRVTADYGSATLSKQTARSVQRLADTVCQTIFHKIEL